MLGKLSSKKWPHWVSLHHLLPTLGGPRGGRLQDSGGLGDQGQLEGLARERRRKNLPQQAGATWMALGPPSCTDLDPASQSSGSLRADEGLAFLCHTSHYRQWQRQEGRCYLPTCPSSFPKTTTTFSA